MCDFNELKSQRLINLANGKTCYATAPANLFGKSWVNQQHTRVENFAVVPPLFVRQDVFAVRPQLSLWAFGIWARSRQSGFGLDLVVGAESGEFQ
jgi:hypothetical protein